MKKLLKDIDNLAFDNSLLKNNNAHLNARISELEADNKKLKKQLVQNDFKVGDEVRCANKHYYCFEQLATVKEIGEDYIVVILNSNGVLVYVNKKDLIKV